MGGICRNICLCQAALDQAFDELARKVANNQDQQDKEDLAHQDELAIAQPDQGEVPKRLKFF